MNTCARAMHDPCLGHGRALWHEVICMTSALSHTRPDSHCLTRTDIKNSTLTRTYVHMCGCHTARLGMPAMRCRVSSKGLLREGVPDRLAAHAGFRGVCYNVVAVLWSPNLSQRPLQIHCARCQNVRHRKTPPKLTPPQGKNHLLIIRQTHCQPTT